MYRIRISSMFFIVVLILLFQFPVLAQEEICDRGINQLLDDPLGYQLRGDRCEGKYFPLGPQGPIVRMVSLTELFEPYDLNSGKELVVEWTVPDTKPVRLRAVGFQSQPPYYRMDTVCSAEKTTYRWSTEILKSLKLSREQIGVVGWAQYPLGEKRDIYLPLRIAQEKTSERSQNYRVALWSEDELTEVYVSLATVRADGSPATFILDGKPLKYGYYPKQRAIVFDIPKPENPGAYYLEIGALLRKGGSYNVEYWIYHAR